jgi:outer membrane cobalamin receptor
VTDINEKHQLNLPESATTLVFSFIGMKTQDVTIGDQSTIYARLLEDLFGIDEVVVSGTATETPRKKLAVSVGKVDKKDMRQVPAFSAGSALHGKLAGVTVINSTGGPGMSSTILVRGAIQLAGSQNPLITVDGVRMQGTMADINVDGMNRSKW